MKLKPIVSIITTAALLAVSFPGINLWPMVYVALVPLLLWSRGKGYREHFVGGAVTGLIFYGITFSWFAALTYWVGSIALAGVGFLLALFALELGLVMLGKRYVEKHAPALLPVALAALWVVMEYAQNHIFTGFGWGSLGYTQWQNLRVAQLASMGSVYIVSFFIVLINALLYMIIVNVRQPKKLLAPTVATILLAVAIPLWGGGQMEQPDISSPLKVGVIQPNFSLDVKWNSEFASHMFWVQTDLTKEVVDNGAELVVWPESALYGYLINEQERIAQIVRRHNVYLLMGSNHYEYSGSANEEPAYFNSAFLLDPQGRILGRYDKRHLAPFGEYVPLANLIGFVGKVVPAISDFTPGERLTLFDVEGRKFAVLICFENSFPHVVRESAQEADFLIQITNDGWFGRSFQPWQDLAIAAFRAIENGMTLVRGTNTGISCFIDPWGRISGMVRSDWGEAVFSRGISEEPISTVAHATFYRTYGDVFALACAGAVVICFGFIEYRRRMSKEGAVVEEPKRKTRKEKAPAKGRAS